MDYDDEPFDMDHFLQYARSRGMHLAENSTLAEVERTYEWTDHGSDDKEYDESDYLDCSAAQAQRVGALAVHDTEVEYNWEAPSVAPGLVEVVPTDAAADAGVFLSAYAETQIEVEVDTSPTEVETFDSSEIDSVVPVHYGGPSEHTPNDTAEYMQHALKQWADGAFPPSVSGLVHTFQLETVTGCYRHKFTSKASGEEVSVDLSSARYVVCGLQVHAVCAVSTNRRASGMACALVEALAQLVQEVVIAWREICVTTSPHPQVLGATNAFSIVQERDCEGFVDEYTTTGNAETDSIARVTATSAELIGMLQVLVDEVDECVYYYVGNVALKDVLSSGARPLQAPHVRTDRVLASMYPTLDGLVAPGRNCRAIPTVFHRPGDVTLEVRNRWLAARRLDELGMCMQQKVSVAHHACESVVVCGDTTVHLTSARAPVSRSGFVLAREWFSRLGRKYQQLAPGELLLRISRCETRTGSLGHRLDKGAVIRAGIGIGQGRQRRLIIATDGGRLLRRKMAPDDDLYGVIARWVAAGAHVVWCSEVGRDAAAKAGGTVIPDAQLEPTRDVCSRVGAGVAHPRLYPTADTLALAYIVDIKMGQQISGVNSRARVYTYADAFQLGFHGNPNALPADGRVIIVPTTAAGEALGAVRLGYAIQRRGPH